VSQNYKAAAAFVDISVSPLKVTPPCQADYALPLGANFLPQPAIYGISRGNQDVFFILNGNKSVSWLPSLPAVCA
jgi:hypothetical protein